MIINTTKGNRTEKHEFEVQNLGLADFENMFWQPVFTRLMTRMIR